MKLGSNPISLTFGEVWSPCFWCRSVCTGKWNTDKAFFILLYRTAAISKAAMVVVTIPTELLVAGYGALAASSSLHLQKVAFPNPRIQHHGGCVLAEGEPAAQERLGGRNSAVEKRKRGFLYHWLIHLTGILEDSVTRKKLSKRILGSRNAGCLNCYLNSVFILCLPGK